MKRGVKTLIAGVLLLVVGVVVVPAACILPFVLGDSDERQFLIPGSMELEIEEPGRYYLWNDYRTVHDGRSYYRSEILPDGLEITIEDEYGQAFPLHSNVSVSSTVGGSSKNSVGYVEVSRPGRVTVSVSGGSEERVFSFSQSRFMHLFGLIFGGIFFSVLLAMTGLGVSIWGIIKLVKGQGKDQHPLGGGVPPRLRQR